MPSHVTGTDIPAGLAEHEVTADSAVLLTFECLVAPRAPRRHLPAGVLVVPVYPPPRIQFTLGQPPLHERGLEHRDHLLVVGVRRPEVATARRGCHLVSRLCRHWRLPASVLQRNRSAAAPQRSPGEGASLTRGDKVP